MAITCSPRSQTSTAGIADAAGLCRAEHDLTSIIDFIALESPGAAEKVNRAIVDAARRLTDFPAMVPAACRAPAKFPVASLPCVIVYDAGADVVTIPAVFHVARDLARALAESRSELKRESR